MLPIRKVAESLIELPEWLHAVTLQKIAKSAMFCVVRLNVIATKGGIQISADGGPT